MKRTKRLFKIVLLAFLVAFVFLFFENIDAAAKVLAFTICAAILILPGTLIADLITKSVEKRQAKEDYRQLLSNKIEKTQYMNGNVATTSKTSTSSAIGRAVVGGAIAGDVGAIVGASTAKQKVKEKHTTTFLVIYKDGHKSLETVEDDSLEYQVYVDKLEIK